MNPDDPLERAWRRLEPPLPGGDLEGESADVREAIERLQRAWRTLRPPVRGRAVRPRSRARWAAAAAALLAAAIWAARSIDRPVPPPEIAAPEPAPAASRPAEEPIVLVSHPDRIELSTSTVTLVLVR